MDDVILFTPDFTQGLLFTTGNIAFLLELVLLYAGISFLMDAERTYRRWVFGVAAAFSGALGLWLSRYFTEEEALYRMICFVTCAFWGTGLLYLLSRLFGGTKLRAWFCGHLRLLARLFGAVLVAGAGIAYFFLYGNSVFFALPLALVCKYLVFMLIGRKRGVRATHTYDELAEKRADGSCKSNGKGRFVRCVLVISMFFTLLYLAWRIFFTVPYRYGILPLIASVLLLAVEILNAIDSFTHYQNMKNIEEYPLPEVPEDKFPHVDVFVSTYTESPELLRKTLLACLRMDYPDKEKVHIYLCDDGHREEMKALAGELGVHYLDRDTHEGAKAGNLNHALANSSSPYVVTFDADMQPRSCFLMRTIPYFVDVEQKNQMLPAKKRVRLGFVQTPQGFYDPDLYQYHLHSEDRIPNEQDYFYRYIQVARTKSNSVIYGGSNTVISRSALHAAGGFYTKTITEDFATGMLIEKKGFASLGTGEPLAFGMNPHSLRDLIRQRVRWARGVIDTGRKMHIFTSPELTTAQKWNYWSSVWYWYAPLKRLVYILFPILFALFGVTAFRYTTWQVLVFWLPMYVLSRLSQRLLGHGVRTAKWTEIYETAMFPFLLFPVILESFGISLRKFKVTNKEQKTGKTRRLLYMLPFLLLTVLSLLGIANCVRVILESGSLGPAILAVWLLFNLFLLVMSLFFTGGRRVNEDIGRVSLEMPGDLTVGDSHCVCVVRTASERELTLDLRNPLSEDGVARLELQTERYFTRLELHLLRRQRRKKTGYRYTFAVADCDNDDHFLAILYDRVPALSDRIVIDGGIFEDLRRNLWRRIWPFSADRG